MPFGFLPKCDGGVVNAEFRMQNAELCCVKHAIRRFAKAGGIKPPLTMLCIFRGGGPLAVEEV